MAQFTIEMGRHQLEINQLLAKNRQLQSENLQLHSQIKGLKAEKLELVGNNDFLTKKREQLENEILVMGGEMNAMEDEMQVFKVRKQSLDESYQKQKNEIIKANKEHLDKMMAIMGEKVELAHAHARELKEYYQRREAERKQEHEQLLKSYQKLSSDYELDMNLFQQCNEDRSSLAADKKSLQSIVSALLEERKVLQNDLSLLQRDLDRSNEAYRQCVEQIEHWTSATNVKESINQSTNHSVSLHVGIVQFYLLGKNNNKTTTTTTTKPQ